MTLWESKHFESQLELTTDSIILKNDFESVRREQNGPQLCPHPGLLVAGCCRLQVVALDGSRRQVELCRRGECTDCEAQRTPPQPWQTSSPKKTQNWSLSVYNDWH